MYEATEIENTVLIVALSLFAYLLALKYWPEVTVSATVAAVWISLAVTALWPKEINHE